jgi:hypothetical protein
MHVQQLSFHKQADEQYAETELQDAVCEAAGMKGGDAQAALKKLGSTDEGKAKLKAMLEKQLPTKVHANTGEPHGSS